MKYFKKIALSIFILLTVMFTFSACGKEGKVVRVDVVYVGSSFDYDKVHSVLSVGYSESLELDESDFNVYLRYKSGAKKKATNFSSNLEEFAHKKVPTGDSIIWFMASGFDGKAEITLRVENSKLIKPHFENFVRAYTGETFSVLNHITANAAFIENCMEIDLARSTLEATRAGTYSVYITLKEGYEWNTAAGKNDEIEFVWEIEKQKIETPTATEVSLEFKHDENYRAVEQGPVLNLGKDADKFEVFGSKNVNAGSYSVSFKLTSEFKENYCFENGKDAFSIGYEILPKVLAPIQDETVHEYSGETIAPTLVNFDENLLNISDFEGNIEIGTYSVIVSIKDEFKSNFVFANGTSEPLEVFYTIGKRIIEVPVLSKTEYEYSGAAAVLKFDNFDSELLNLAMNSSDINVGSYSATVSLKEGLSPNNYAFAGSSSVGNMQFGYKIVPKVLYASDFEWDYTSPIEYDGLAHSVVLKDSPFDVLVSYENNTATEIGDYSAIAHLTISNMNYKLAAGAETLTLDYSIIRGADPSAMYVFVGGNKVGLTLDEISSADAFANKAISVKFDCVLDEGGTIIKYTTTLSKDCLSEMVDGRIDIKFAFNTSLLDFESTPYKYMIMPEFDENDPFFTFEHIEQNFVVPNANGEYEVMNFEVVDNSIKFYIAQEVDVADDLVGVYVAYPVVIEFA